MKCKNCGKGIGNDMSFCPYCGSKQDLENSQDVTEKKVKKTVKSKNDNTKKTAVIKNISSQTDSYGEDDNIIKEFAIKVLRYMRRSKSERQIVLYANKYAQTIQYCKQHNIDSDFEPFIFAEALRILEQEKGTTIHHIEAEEIIACIEENKDEFVMRQEQAEQAHKTEPKKESNSSSMGKIFGWGIIIVLFLMLKMCGGCNGCGGNDVSNDSFTSTNAPSWIQGSWKCSTPYGSMKVVIEGDHIREIFSDGGTFYGTYHIDGDYIIPETGSHTHYEMDKYSNRLSAGQGYYFEKQ